MQALIQQHPSAHALFEAREWGYWWTLMFWTGCFVRCLNIHKSYFKKPNLENIWRRNGPEPGYLCGVWSGREADSPNLHYCSKQIYTKSELLSAESRLGFHLKTVHTHLSIGLPVSFPFIMGITASCPSTVCLFLLGEQGKPWSPTAALQITCRTSFFIVVGVFSCILAYLFFSSISADYFMFNSQLSFCDQGAFSMALWEEGSCQGRLCLPIVFFQSDILISSPVFREVLMVPSPFYLIISKAWTRDICPSAVLRRE